VTRLTQRDKSIYAFTPLEIIPRLRGRSHFGAAKGRCSAVTLERVWFVRVPAAVNAPLKFLMGLTPIAWTTRIGYIYSDLKPCDPPTQKTTPACHGSMIHLPRY
jgi:hypothetical protein